jgi:hypothetical protein
VAIVYPIHAAIAKIPATAMKAVICSVIRAQLYTNHAYRMIPRTLSARISAPHVWSLLMVYASPGEMDSNYSACS